MTENYGYHGRYFTVAVKMKSDYRKGQICDKERCKKKQDTLGHPVLSKHVSGKED